MVAGAAFFCTWGAGWVFWVEDVLVDVDAVSAAQTGKTLKLNSNNKMLFFMFSPFWLVEPG